jgi:hypothetical protein
VLKEALCDRSEGSGLLRRSLWESTKLPVSSLRCLLGRRRRTCWLKLPRFRGVELDVGDYGSVVTASIAAS